MKTEIVIEGLHCKSCVDKAQNAIKAVSGVTEVVVDLKDSKANIESETELSMKEVRRALDKVGFTLKQ